MISDFNKQLVHNDEETEEHTEPSVSEKPPQTVDIGFYFAGGIIALSIIGFVIYRFFIKKEKNIKV